MSRRNTLVALMAALASCTSDPDPERQDGGGAGMAAPHERDASLDARVGMPADAGTDGAIVDGGATDGSTDAGDGSTGTDGAADAGLDAAPQDAASDGAMPEPERTTHVYVGGYGSEIAHFVLDRQTGALGHQGSTSAGTAPSYVAIAPDSSALYAVNEVNDSSSQVIAFAIDPDSGALSMINAVPSGGQGAPHLTVHPTGQWVAVAHYGSGHTSILPVRADHGLNGAIAIVRGPGDAARKAHQAVFDTRGTTLLIPCLESNYVLQYQFSQGALALNVPPSVAVAGGPRHMALSPDQQHAYVLSELDSTITSFDYDGLTGRLSNPAVIDSEEDTKGASAHIAVHPSGKWLYVSNRAENSLGQFAINPAGQPQPVAFERAGIATPRNFAIDPSGQYLILANHDGAQDLRVYRIDPDDGGLTYLRSANVGGHPSAVAFAVL